MLPNQRDCHYKEKSCHWALYTQDTLKYDIFCYPISHLLPNLATSTAKMESIGELL